MPRPKVYREYFPSCIERFFGGGKPRRIKARCFVPYTEAEENTEVFLGPSPGAPNIDLNMTVQKEPHRAVNYDYEDEQLRYAIESKQGDGLASLHEESCSQRMDCGCRCRCNESSSATSSSTTSYSSSDSKRSKPKTRPKILVLEDDGRYREINEEFVGVHRVPERNRAINTSSSRSAKLVMKESKIDVIFPSMTSPGSTTPPASEVFSWDDCAVKINPERQEGPKKGVVLGYVMFDPESEDKRLYVTTTDGKKISPATLPGSCS